MTIYNLQFPQAINTYPGQHVFHPSHLKRLALHRHAPLSDHALGRQTAQHWLSFGHGQSQKFSTVCLANASAANLLKRCGGIQCQKKLATTILSERKRHSLSFLRGLMCKRPIFMTTALHFKVGKKHAWPMMRSWGVASTTPYCA